MNCFFGSLWSLLYYTDLDLSFDSILLFCFCFCYRCRSASVGLERAELLPFLFGVKVSFLFLSFAYISLSRLEDKYL